MKIGGSIFEEPSVIEEFLRIFFQKRSVKMKYVILSGGGRECDNLREIFKADSLKEIHQDQYHWKAITLMEINTVRIKTMMDFLLQDSHAVITSKITKINSGKPGIYYFLPYQNLYDEDPLEHSWRVTSDSIAIYYANLLNSRICLLIKHKPYLFLNNRLIRSISASELYHLHRDAEFSQNLGKGLVDPMGPELCLKFKIPILILDGTNRTLISRFFSQYPHETNYSDLSKYGLVIYPK